MSRKLYCLKQCRIFGEPGDFIETSAFGRRKNPVTGEDSMHRGLDGALWNGKCVETWILAVAPGTITACETSVTGFSKEYPAGNFVVIDHGNGRVTKYFHFEPGTIRVAAGDRVETGAVLGYMGKTGMATGEHIHFQLEHNGKPRDPRGVMLTGSFNPLVGAAAVWIMRFRRLFCKYRIS